MRMEKEPTLLEILLGDTRAEKMKELAQRLRDPNKPLTLIDVENLVVETITGVPKRDDIIEGQD